MPKTNVYDMTGKQVGEIELSEAVFGIEPNESVVHDVVKNHLANCRQGTQSALTRAEVSGGGIEAVASEGHRPCPSGQHPRSSVDARRHRLCTEAQRLQLHPQQEGEASGSEVRAECEGCHPTIIVVVDAIKMERAQDQEIRRLPEGCRTLTGKALVVTA